MDEPFVHWVGNGLPAVRSTATTAAAATVVAAAATGHFFGFAPSPAIRATGGRSEALLLEECLLTFGEGKLIVTITA